MMARIASHRAGRRILAVLLVAGVKLALRAAPARTLRAIHRSCREPSDCAPPDDRGRVEVLRRLVSSIAGASRLMSGTCLDSALASCVAARLLRAHVSLGIGVDRLRPELRAHAWVECGGTVLAGGPALVAFDR